MKGISGEVISVLVYLLPGFVAAAIFYSLTSHVKPNNFERLIQALIFTAIAQGMTVGIKWLFFDSAQDWSDQQKDLWNVLVPMVTAVALSVLTVALFNYDVLHLMFRFFGITRETSYSSEWYSSFVRNSDCYVILHLKGNRRLFGWPEEWPSNPKDGHFRISEGEWLLDQVPSQKANWKKVEEINAIVISVEEVEMVEFVQAVTSCNEELQK